MAVIKRDDGLVDVTDEFGGVALEGIPPEYAPADVRDPWAPEPEPVAAPKEQIVDPWANPGPKGSNELYYSPDMPMPPSLTSQASAGPGTEGELVPQSMRYTGPAVPPEKLAPSMQGMTVPAGQQQAAPAPASAPGPAPAGNLAGPGDASTVQGMGAPTGEPGAPGGTFAPTRGAIVRGAALGRPIPASKPGWYPSTTSIERTAPLPDEILADFAGASMAQREAAEGLGAARGATQHEIALAQAERQEAAKTQLAEIERRKAEEQDLLDRRMKVVSMKQAELRDARKKFDPDKYWNDKGTFGTVLAKIGVALSDLGSSVLGQKNPVREQIQQEIDRSIAVQERQLDYLGDDLGAEYTILGEMRKNFADKDSAAQATRALMQEAAAAHIDEIASMGGSMETVQAAKAQAADLRMQANQNLMDVYQKQQGVIHEQAVYSRGGGGGSTGSVEKAYKLHKMMGGSDEEFAEIMATGGLREGIARPKDQNEAQRKQQEFQLGRRVRLPDNTFAWAPTEKYAEAARDVVAAHGALTDNYARQLELIHKFGKSMSPEIRGEYDTLVQANMATMKQLETLGAITAADQQLVDPLIGRGGAEIPTGIKNLDSYVKSQIKTSLQHVEKRLHQRYHELYKDVDATIPITGEKHFKPAELEK